MYRRKPGSNPRWSRSLRLSNDESFACTFPLSEPLTSAFLVSLMRKPHLCVNGLVFSHRVSRTLSILVRFQEHLGRRFDSSFLGPAPLLDCFRGDESLTK